MNESISGTDFDFNIWSDGHELSNEQARELMSLIERDPGDAVSILKLLGHYSVSPAAPDVERWLGMATWFIRNRPGDWITGHYTKRSGCTAEQEAFLDHQWEEVIVSNPYDPKICGRGGQYFDGRDSNKAIHHLNRAIELDPRNAEWFTSLFYLYMSLAEQSNFTNELFVSLAFENGVKAVKFTKMRGPKKGLLEALCLFGLDSNNLSKAVLYARLVLREARKVDWPIGMFSAYILHGRVQLRLGHIDHAKKHLVLAGQQCFFGDFSLASELIQIGEKEVVVDFLTRWLPNADYPANTLNEWLEQIEKGQCPKFS